MEPPGRSRDERMAVMVSRTTLFLFIMFFALLREAGAVPAAPFIHQLRQPAGDTFAARQWGDEFQAGWETREGYTILFDQELGAWTYAEHGSSGELKSNRRQVGKDAPHKSAKGARPLKGHGLSRRALPFAFSPAVSSGALANTAGAGSVFETTTQTGRNIP